MTMRTTALVLSLLVPTQGCTTLLLGKDATVDGSVIATHSNDGEAVTDPRLVRIPAADWPAGSTRPVWPSPEDYPRYVGAARGAPPYFAAAGENETAPVGAIAQVNHTYAYFEETYGALSEVQLGIGESTCSGAFAAVGVEEGGAALFSIDELSKIAMERAATAREAVQLMGDLAVAHGFHGQSASFEGGSESLMVVDPREGFVFHVLADASGASAIWVAQRVPDGHMAVVANHFTIREVDLDDDANFLGRADMWELAAAAGLWDASRPKDFTRTFSDGEYAHKYYSGRRMWGAFRLAAPAYTAAHLPPEYGSLKDDAPYPFAVAVERKLAVADVFAIHRDWYNGTDYDLSAGMQGGFGGSPDRYGGCAGAGCDGVAGNWERSISLYRTSDTVVVQARGWLPDAVGGTLWFAPHAAHGSLFVPFSAGAARAPTEYSRGWAGERVGAARARAGAYWACRAATNAMQLHFSAALPLVRAAQADWEARGLALQARLAAASPPPDANALAEAHGAFARAAMRAWWELSDEILFAVADGDANRWEGGKFVSEPIGYPDWWLADPEVGYTSGPPPP